MNQVIHLLRHAETSSNKSGLADSRIDSELSEAWIHEVEALKWIVSSLSVDIIIVSPLRRTTDTITPLLEMLNYPPIYISELILERNLGDFTGTKMGEFQKFCDENGFNKVSHRPNNGESLIDTYKRAKEFHSYIISNFPGKEVLVCGHKNFLMCLYILLSWGEILKYYDYPEFKNAELRTLNI